MSVLSSKSVKSNNDESKASVTKQPRSSVSRITRAATLRPLHTALSDKIESSDDASRISQTIQQQLEAETLILETPITSTIPSEHKGGFDPELGNKNFEEGHNIRFGSPKILNLENLEKNQKNRTRIEGENGWKPQPPTVNDRLRQAKIFLSDEDVNRHLQFVSRHEKIDKFLQHLANEKVECDIRLYNEVQAMVQVHRSRMNRQKPQNNERPNGDLGSLQSNRSSLVDTSKHGLLRGAPLRDDHPPFTLERPPDQKLFLQAIHGLAGSNEPGVKNRGVELLEIDRDSFLETLDKPALVHEWVEEGESQTRDARFNARAKKRGRRRAAIRMALRSFATNCEQHHRGRWEQNDPRLPVASVDKIPEQGIAFAGQEDAQKNYETSFSWPQKYPHSRQFPQDRPKVSNDRSLQDLAQPLNGNQPIPTEKQGLDRLRAKILKEKQESRQRLEATNDENWATPILEPERTKQHFSPDRWSGTAPRPNQVAPPTEEDPQPVSQAPPENRASVITREIQENSQSYADGLGIVIPEEIQQVDPRQEHLLEDATDPKETFYPGAAAFMFAETPFLRAMMSNQIEQDLGLGREFSLSMTFDTETKSGNLGKSRKRTPHNLLHLPSAQFSLPEPASTQESGQYPFFFTSSLPPLFALYSQHQNLNHNFQLPLIQKVVIPGTSVEIPLVNVNLEQTKRRGNTTTKAKSLNHPKFKVGRLLRSRKSEPAARSSHARYLRGGRLTANPAR